MPWKPIACKGVPRSIWLYKVEVSQQSNFSSPHGAKIDLPNSECETPLHEAAFSAQPEAIRALLDAGADIDLPTGDYNYTALHNVVKYKNTVTPQQIETIKPLLDRGLDVNAEADN